MVSLADVSLDFQPSDTPISEAPNTGAGRAFDMTTHDFSASLAWQVVLSVVGVALIASALGMWLFPQTQHDAAMQLIKLLVSMSMLGMGLLCATALRARPEGRAVELDLRTRELRVMEYSRRNPPVEVGRHAFAALSELTLQDRFLTARDANGRLILAAPVRNRAAERAILKGLRQG